MFENGTAWTVTVDTEVFGQTVSRSFESSDIFECIAFAANS